MKYLSFGLLLLTVFVGSCQKSDDLSNSSALNLIAGNTPVASFKITNMPAPNYITEGKNLIFQNTSQNAVSYHWDFGNGITYDYKTPPKDIYYIPCGGNYTITLTIKNTSGEVSTYSQSFTVLCSGRNTHGTHLPE